MILCLPIRYFIIICIHHFLLTVSMLKHPRTPPTNSLAMDYQTADSESVLKRPRPFGISDGVLTAAYSFFSLRSHP